MKSAILETLNRESRPRTAAEIAVTMSRNGHAATTGDVMTQLLAMQREGLVTIEGQRWRALVTQPRAARTPSSAPQSADLQQPFRPSSSSPGLPTRWDEFRRLCSYYIDCLRREEQVDIKCYGDSEDKHWIQVDRSPNWVRMEPDAGGETILLSSSQSPFIREMRRHGSDQCVYLGYPCEVVQTPSNGAWLVPVFLIACDASFDASHNAIRLEATSDAVANQAWVDGAFWKKDERRDAAVFLSDMGLVTDVADGPAWPTISQLTQRLQSWMGDKIPERLDSGRIKRLGNLAGCRPGIVNACVVAIGQPNKYTRGLIREIQNIAQWRDDDLDDTALAAFFPHNRSIDNGESTPYQPVPPGLQPDRLVQLSAHTEAQRLAAIRAGTRAKSLIDGPPGTGKSTVARSILVNQLLRGRTTLFASKNHKALDAVVPGLNALAAHGSLIIRTSHPSGNQSVNWRMALRELLARPARAADGGQALVDLADHLTTMGNAESAIAAYWSFKHQAEQLATEAQKALDQVPLVCRTKLAPVQWNEQHDKALATGESLSKQLSVQRSLIHRLVWLMCGRKKAAERQLDEVQNQLPMPDSELSERLRLLRLWATCQQLRGALHLCEAEAASRPYSTALTAIERSSREMHACVQRLLDSWANGRPATVSKGSRETLMNLRSAVTTWGEQRFASEIKQHFPAIAKQFPLWASTNLSVGSALPLVHGIADLVIVDEASQCDIPSVIPLLARARRACLIGDPLQLRHITKLQESEERQLLSLHRITDLHLARFSYRQNSAYDLASGCCGEEDCERTFLDVHFRCHPSIAEYASNAFYGRGWEIVSMGAADRRSWSGISPGLSWVDVDSRPQRGHGSGAWSPQEVEAVVDIVTRCVGNRFKGTIGVVTPFGEQVRRIEDALRNRLPTTAWTDHRLIVDTAHGFQGDERDIMVFSLCLGPEMPESAMRWLTQLDNKNIFNVAATRAKAALIVVGHASWASACGVPHVVSLWKSCHAPASGSAPTTSPYESPWEEALDTELRKAGISTVPQYRIGNRRLDLAVPVPLCIDIEVDGAAWHLTSAGRRKDDDYWRDLMLESLGWTVLRFWVKDIRDNPVDVVRRIQQHIREKTVKLTASDSVVDSTIALTVAPSQTTLAHEPHPVEPVPSRIEDRGNHKAVETPFVDIKRLAEQAGISLAVASSLATGSRNLLWLLLAQDIPRPVIGYELVSATGECVEQAEIAWPECHVAILTADARAHIWSAAGWQAWGIDMADINPLLSALRKKP
jgi:very-short-patch-repair endonuclease